MYQNYDEMVKELAKKYVKCLKREGITHMAYYGILDRSFASRVCFFENVCRIEKVRKYVLDIIMRNDYDDKLNSIEKKFVEQYNAVCEVISCPKVSEESFFEEWNTGNLDRDLYRYDENRIARYVHNERVVEVVKHTPEYLEEKKELLGRIKEKAADIVYEIIKMAGKDEELWKDA